MLTNFAMLDLAHRGYDYQDLICAIRVVDLLLGSVESVTVDRKRFSGDRFDDLCLVWPDGRREHLQFKRRDHADEPLPLNTFTSDRRDCLLSMLVLSTVRDVEPDLALYRLVVTDSPPQDAKLVSALMPLEHDPGPFIPGAATQRYRFNCDVLWPMGSKIVPHARRTANTEDVWIGVRSGAITRDQLSSFCERFILETSAPVDSLGNHEDGPAVDILLRRLGEDVGVGVHPNEDRSPPDVAALLLGAVRAARNGTVEISSDEVLRKTRLRYDYGTTQSIQPVSPSLEVNRSDVIARVIAQIEAAGQYGGYAVMTGPPGRGKSWTCSRIADSLRTEQWVVAIHYCYWNEDDTERERRARAQVIFGSLIHQLVAQEPGLANEQAPILAATPEKLRGLVSSICARSPASKVLLIVDGLDHITRVLGRTSGRKDPSVSVAEELAGFELPPGSVMLVACQPGAHADPFKRAGATEFELPDWPEDEIRELAVRLGVLQPGPPVNEKEAIRLTLPLHYGELGQEMVRVVTTRSGGNPLHATYLLREIELRSRTMTVQSALRQIPEHGGSLDVYYERILDSVREVSWLPEALALMDFSITRDELREMFPGQSRKLQEYLSFLAPVLSEKVSTGGIRIYHESFARFLLARLDGADDISNTATPILAWLEKRGEFTDSRAFRNLLPMLVRVGRDADVIARATPEYLHGAVSAGFGAQAIVRNFEVIAAAAGGRHDWKAVTRCLELARAAHTFESERIEILAKYAAVPLFVLGKPVFGDRLLFDGRTVLPYRAGLLYCASLDAVGEQAPWREYIDTYRRGRDADSTVYADDDRTVELSYLLGFLRTSDPDTRGLSRIAEWISAYFETSETRRLHVYNQGRRCIDVLLKGLRIAKVAQVVSRVAPDSHRAVAMLLFADGLARRSMFLASRRWAGYAAELPLPSGHVYTLVRLGVAPRRFRLDKLRERLVSLTEELQTLDVARFDLNKYRSWCDLVMNSAHFDPLLLSSVELNTQRPGWYHCWLRYNIEITRLAASIHQGQEPNPSAKAMSALRVLQNDLNPSPDVPSSMLFSLGREIQQSVQRGLVFVDDVHWRAAIQVIADVSVGLREVSVRAIHPLPPNFVREVGLEFCTPIRAEATLDVLSRALYPGETDFYGQHAEGELLMAAIAQRGNLGNRAREHWENASRFMVAYGFRKDMTIFDLVVSAKFFAESNTPGIRARLAALQALCLRVTNHDDRDETGFGTDLWWELIGTADPMGTALLLCKSRLDSSSRIDPEHFNRAARSIYRKKWDSVEAVTAACLRLVVDSDVVEADLRLLQSFSDVDVEICGALVRGIIAKLEEQSSHRLDDVVLHDFASASQKLQCGRLDLKPRPIKPSFSGRGRPSSLAEAIDERLPLEWTSEHLEGNIRLWAERPYGSRAPKWEVEPFAHRLGWAILELYSDGRQDTAESCVYLFADVLRGEEAPAVLSGLAAKFEQHGASALAVLSYVLAFTRSRGGGGWLNFGDGDDARWLSSAVLLDKQHAFRVLTDEVLWLLQTWRYHAPGVTRAFVEAFRIMNEMGLHDTTGLEIWDAAFGVIEKRLMATGGQDVPLLPYLPAEESRGADERSANSRDDAIITAVCAYALHPGRDKKRQALFAISLLMRRNPEATVDGLLRLLPEIRDYSTLSWVLQLLRDVAPLHTNALGKKVSGVLQSLAKHPGLVIRTLVRNLAAQCEVETAYVPVFECGDEFFVSAEFAEGLMTDSERRTRRMMLAIAAREIGAAENLLSGFTAYASLRLDRLLAHPSRRDLDAWQRRALSANDERQPPEVLRVAEACVQRAIQDVAGEGRSALARRGEILSDPDVWEQEMADALVDDMSWPLRAESCRVAFSSLPSCYLGKSSDAWRHFRERENGGVEDFEHGEAPVVESSDGDYGDWRILGVVESRFALEGQFPGKQSRLECTSWRTLALASPYGGLNPAQCFNECDLRGWTGLVVSAVNRRSLGYGTLTGLTFDGMGALWYVFGPRRSLLVPNVSVSEFLGLRTDGTSSVRLCDEKGIALALRIWRSASSLDGRVLLPEFWGMDIVLRPDLYLRLVSQFGGRLRWLSLAQNLSDSE